MLNVIPRRFSTSLRAALGLILALEGTLTLIHSLSVHHDPHSIAFGATETVAAMLFILPRTMRVGGCILFCAFLIGAGIHLLHGEFPSEHLVYALAVLLVMTGAGARAPGGMPNGSALS